MGYNKITEITTKDIFNLFCEGYIDDSFSLLGDNGERMIYAYCGDVDYIMNQKPNF